MRLPVTVAALVLALGCAPARQQGHLTVSARAEGARPAATARVGDSDSERILLWRRAAVVLRERGLGVASRGANRIVTTPRELDVPCGGGTCLARELFVVSVVGEEARVELLRGVWDAGARSWVMSLSPATAADAAAKESELLRAIVEPVAAARASKQPVAPALSLAR